MHHFIVMAPEIKNEFYFNTTKLDEASELVLPHYVSKGATITPCKFEKFECKMNGIWTVIDVKGS